MWKVFLTQWNGRSFFLEMGNGSKGTGRLTSLSTKKTGISIEWQQLFPIVIACALWYPHFAGKRLQFWCHNESVVAIHGKTLIMIS